MGLLSFAVLVGAIVFGYINRTNGYTLGLTFVVAGYALTNFITRLAILDRSFVGPTLLAGTRYRFSQIRVSIAYLISIPVEGQQLLVRGHRISTQYQPVGGVFKTRLSELELSRMFNAKPDTRFTPDEKSTRDLRLRVPGKDLHRLLRWFRSREDRELFPWREFYEELVAPGILDATVFAYFDCSYIGTKHLPMKFDRFSQCQQLIIAELYELQPTTQQSRGPSRASGEIHVRPLK